MLVMKIKREDISKKIISLSLAGMIALGGGIAISPAFAKAEDPRILQQIEYEKREFQYITNVSNADLSQFDEHFLDIYHNGKIKIQRTDKEYDLDKLYLIEGTQDDVEKHYIVSYEQGDVDILTGNSIKNFNRTFIMKLIDTSFLYDWYSIQNDISISGNYLFINPDNEEAFNELLETFDNSMHNRVPETYFKK